MSRKRHQNDSDVLICARIADMPEAPVPSLPRICDLCGFRVWVSLKSPPTDEILCQHCASDEVDSGTPIHATQETIAEVKAALKGRLS